MTHTFEINKVYTVTHTRKGKFTIKVTEQCSEWVHGVITQGVAQALLPENVLWTGDSITLRKVFIKEAKLWSHQ